MQQFGISSVLMSKVVDLARKAGSAILSVFFEMAGNDAVFVTQKVDGSPLTKADLDAHQIIAAGLAALTPSIPVVSEEDIPSFAHRKPKGLFWLIDPLDGTKEFLALNDEFTVNIALIKDGQPVFGVVVAPALDLTYWGADGHGAWRVFTGTKKQIKTSPLPDILRIAASKSHLNAETSSFIEQLGSHVLLRVGSSLKFCRIAEGNADVYPRLAPTCEWDTAAGQAVLEAAGGHVFTLDGCPLLYGKSSVLNPYFIASSAEFAGLLRPE
jgi:3'(2'), 5'-bisphosphate nucleotidase